jgi:hypothetical protein
VTVTSIDYELSKLKISAITVVNAVGKIKLSHLHTKPDIAGKLYGAEENAASGLHKLKSPLVLLVLLSDIEARFHR